MRVTLIDRRNHHLFQPLLYQVATAGLNPADIAAPIRAILADQTNVRRRCSARSSASTDEQRSCSSTTARRSHFDYLVLAAGTTHSYFGNRRVGDRMRPD